MPQNRITILATRSIDQALLRNASSKNISIDIVPFIKTEPALTSDVLKEVQKRSIGSAVIFTSSNAVEAIATLDQQKTTLVGQKIFCIGYATRRSVAEYFGERSIAGVADNAKELAELIIDAGISKAIFFCGDQRRDELPDQLKKNKVDVHEVIVYKTIPTPVMINKKYDGILFFSPSAVKSFFQENKLDQQVILFAIGSTTAEEIKKFCGNKIVISDVPDKKILVDKVTFYFQANPTHH